MVDAINSWIKNGCNYTEGVGLYDQYGTNNFLKGVFKRSETAINRQKLNAELVLIRDSAKPETLKSVVSEIQKVKSDLARTNPHDVGFANKIADLFKLKEAKADIDNQVRIAEPQPLPALLQVINQREQSFNEIRSLHPLLSTELEGESLRLIAAQIVKQGKKNAELWQRYNYLTEHAGEPDQVTAPLPPPVMIDANLLDQRELIRKSLNKAQNRIKGEAKPKQKTLDLIAQKTLQLKEIDAKITAIKKGCAQ